MKSIASDSRRAAAYVTFIFQLCMLTGCIAPAQVRDAATTSPPQAEGPIHETLTGKAWQYHNARDYEQAIDTALECVEEFAGEAARIQVKLEKDQVGIPVHGRNSIRGRFGVPSVLISLKDSKERQV